MLDQHVELIECSDCGEVTMAAERLFTDYKGGLQRVQLYCKCSHCGASWHGKTIETTENCEVLKARSEPL